VAGHILDPSPNPTAEAADLCSLVTTAWYEDERVEQMFATLAAMDRRHELENIRRSIALLTTGAAPRLDREDALSLLAELTELTARMEHLRQGVRRLVDLSASEVPVEA
jgi:hypothetical protein